MDKLRTDLFGGFPFELDDWRWEIDSHRTALQGLCRGLQGSDPGGIIVSGVEVTLNPTGGVLSVSPGWVSWAGELWYYPGGPGNGAIGPNLHFLFRESTYDPSDAEVFEDGSIQNAYERRRVKLVATGVDYSATAFAEMYMPIGRAVRLRSLLWPGAWVAVTDFLGDWSSPAGIQVRLEPGGIVRLKGTVEYAGGPTGASGIIGMFMLPPGYRPTGSVIKSVALFPYSDTPRPVQVQFNGIVALHVMQSGVSSGAKVYLSDLTFTVS